MVYAREVGDKVLTFDFAMGLINDNLLVVDRETESVWSQLDNACIAGPMTGEPMQVVPALQTTWAFWRTRHPDTKVLMEEGVEGRRYLYRTWMPGQPRPEKRPTSHDVGILGLGVSAGGESAFFPFRELEKLATPMKHTLGGATLTIHYVKEAFTAWAEDADGNLLPGVLAYEPGWKNFNPDTAIFVVASDQP